MTTRAHLDQWTDDDYRSEISLSKPPRVARVIDIGVPALTGRVETASSIRFERDDRSSLTKLFGIIEKTLFDLGDTTSQALLVTVPDLSATAKVMQEMHDKSGLTWDELARIFGVSRRSLHHWARGGRLNAYNSRRLQRVYEVVVGLDAGDADQTRLQLISPDETGLSVFQRLVQERASRSPREGFLPDELLGGESPAAADADD